MKLLILASLLFSAEAFPWGATGHRAVGEIAQQHLTRRAYKQITRILGGESLAQASTWPDEIKSEPETYKYTYNWHYTDWPDHMHDHDESTSSGKLMTSIKEQLAVLKDPAADVEKKKFALRFVVHLIGDLHMPLHVGNGIDRGGNSCRVTFHGRNTNLHALWDEGMIEFTDLSFTELARFAQEGKKKKDRWAVQTGTPVDWARESKILRGTIYPENVKVDAKPIASVKEYCRTDITVAPEMMPKLGYEYSYKFMPIVEEKIYQAGVRLAYLLNQNL